MRARYIVAPNDDPAPRVAANDAFLIVKDKHPRRHILIIECIQLRRLLAALFPHTSSSRPTAFISFS
jgi:hypothetical protein